ncbi:MAG: ribosome biogenesis factor YjgA [Xanthomonadales bacterium]
MNGHKEQHSREIEFISKSQRKRDARVLKSLASELIKLSSSQLAKVPLEETIREAVQEARQIRSHVAGKRQLQFIAKQLRRIDATPIRETIDSFQNKARQSTVRQHRVENWRDFLLESGDAALGKLLQHRHTADGQAIRQLIRNAQREASRGKPPASARALFRLLRDMDENEPLPSLI